MEADSPVEIEWTVETPIDLVVEIDPLTNRATIKAPEEWQGSELITFIARSGTSIQRNSILLSATSSSQPTLGQLPELTITAGQFDQSIDLDEFVTGVDPAELTWEVSGNNHTQVVVDDEGRLIILADADWNGSESLILSASNASGQVLQGILSLEILPLSTELGLRSVSQVPLFAGDDEIALDLSDLLLGSVEPSQLSWQLKSNSARELTSEYDPVQNVLKVQSNLPWQLSDIVTVTAEDQSGHVATGQLLLEVAAVDGSVGEVSSDFTLVVVPNVFQPEFLDLFVISDMDLGQAPRLRLLDDRWRDLAVSSTAPGIWYGDHTLRPGQEGQIQFLALAFGDQQQIVKADLELTVGTVQPPSAKSISGEQLTVFLPANSFSDEAVIALIPSPIEEVGEELVPLSEAFTVHSPQRYEPRPNAVIQFELGYATPHSAIYRWDEEQSQWMFVGAEAEAGQIVAPLIAFGRYALMADHTPPRLVEVARDGGSLRLLWSDQGSGLGTNAPTVLVDGGQLPERDFSWDGEWLEILPENLREGPREISISLADQSGNTSAVYETDVAGSALPGGFSIGQNFPNPFNPSTTIPLRLLESGHVRLTIFNAAGQQIRMLLDDFLPSGAHEISWDARNESGEAVSSGLYLYRIDFASVANASEETRRLSRRLLSPIFEPPSQTSAIREV